MEIRSVSLSLAAALLNYFRATEVSDSRSGQSTFPNLLNLTVGSYDIDHSSGQSAFPNLLN